ncbi:MAG: peptide ABC transporter substrate-binding protein [Phycisphaerales bacterium]|nr:MAG: peptide ABC transporter substrate-binding protein [Phycisphaerales bacterium]
MIRNLILLCLALFLVLLWAYTGGGSEPRADLAYVNPSGIHTLDPARMSWTQDFRIALNIWEGLTTYHPRTLEPMEGAAFYPPEIADDQLTYTFKIRPDARWSNGDPVTADDFVRGWRRCLEPGTATDYTFLLTDHIQGAREYVDWRRGGVLLLTALTRLRDGEKPTEEEAVAVAEALTRKEIGARDARLHEELLVSGEDREVAAYLREADLDWAGLYREAFESHASAFEERFAEVKLEVPRPDTFVVRLTSPTAYFLDLTAFPTLVPVHESVELLREGHEGAPITEEGLVVYDPQWTKPNYHRNEYPGLITNGSYVLADWKFKRRARMEVNPFHRDAGAIRCRTVDMIVYDDLNTALMAYERGDLDFLPAMDVAYDHEIARLAISGERPDFHACTLLATYFLNFNCVSSEVGKRNNPFTDARVRKAFALAVDKRAIVEQVLKRGDRVARSFVPPTAIPGYDPPEGLGEDVSAARSLLADAGYPDGAGMGTIELLHTPRDEVVCQALARMWQDRLGLRVELRCKESKTFGEDKANHRYMIARGNWYADYNDPTTFLDCLSTGNGNNDSGYSNPAYDELLNRAAAVRERDRRAELLRQAEAILVERDFPILPILHYTTPIAIKPHVKGLKPNPRLLFPFRYVSVER